MNLYKIKEEYREWQQKIISQDGELFDEDIEALKSSPGVKNSSYQMAISRQKSLECISDISSFAFALSFLR